MNTNELLLDIARCPVFMGSEIDPAGRCNEIISLQRQVTAPHLPEPWSGSLETAPILFISSNPSIDESERYPTNQWPNGLIRDFFEHRFSDGIEPWTEGSLRPLLADGQSHSSGYVRFWASVRARATEL